MKNYILSFLLAVSCFGISFAQNFNAKVVSFVPIGPGGYYFLEDLNAPVLYKTSMFDAPMYNINDLVDLAGFNGELQRIVVDSDGRVAYKQGVDPDLSFLIFEDMPTLHDEILYFRDTTHVQSFLNQIMIIDSTFNNYELTSILDELETRFQGFTSMRQQLVNEFGDLETVGLTDEEFLLYEEKDFIGDESIKALLSKHRLVGVDDRVYFYNYWSEIISVDKGDQEAIDMLKDLPSLKRYDMSDFNNIITRSPRFRYDKTKEGHRLGKFDTEENSENMNSARRDFLLIDITETTSNAFRTTLNVINENSCDVHTKKLWVLFDYIEGLDEEGNDTPDTQLFFYDNEPGRTIIIDWGDGSVETIENYTSQALYHTYDQTLTFTTIKVKTLFNGYELNDERDFPLDIICTGGEHANWWHKEQGNYRLRSKIWVSDNFWGRHVGSYTEAYQKDGNNWKKIRASIHTFVEGSFANANCVIVETKTETDSKSNGKSVQAVKTRLFARQKLNWTTIDGEVWSYHTLIKNGTVINHAMHLQVCP